MATGLLFSEQLKETTDPEQRERLLAAGGFKAIAPLLDPRERILALGDAAPYLSPRRYEYATVWDTHPLARLIEEHPEDPDAVIEALRKRGTTLLLVNYPMLERWSTSGWLDPRLEPGRIKAVLERLQPQFQWMNGEALFRIPVAGGAAAPESVGEASSRTPVELPADS